MLSKMNLISVVKQLPKEDIETIQGYVEMIEEENQELKKQLEERPKEYVFIGNAQNKTRDFINQITKDNKEFKNQQKEFIKYLEEEKDRLASVCSSICEDKFDEADDILQKYKEIIGDDK